MNHKTLSEAIEELEKPISSMEKEVWRDEWDNGYLACAEGALPIIREQDRRIELLRGVLEILKLERPDVLVKAIDAALAVTSIDAEWKV